MKYKKKYIYLLFYYVMALWNSLYLELYYWILTNIIFYVEKEHEMYAILHRTSEKICHSAIF